MFRRLFAILLLCFVVMEAVYLGYRLPRQVQYPVIDPRLAPFLDDFVRDAAERGVTVDTSIIGAIVFAKLPNGLAGLCNSLGAGWDAVVKHTAVVLIDVDYADGALMPNDYTFRALVYHELGHCLLYKVHDPTAYLTIMSDFPIGTAKMSYQEMSQLYRDRWKEELDDLFYRLPPARPRREFLIK